MWCQVIRSAAPVTQNHLPKPEDLLLQNATPLRKSTRWPPNISDAHVSCIAPATRHASAQILLKCPTPAILFGNATKPSPFAHFWQGAQSPSPATQNDIWTFKRLRTLLFFALWTSKCASRRNGVHFFDATSKSALNRQFFALLTSKCASRHNSVHFFDISTSKSALNRHFLTCLTSKCALRQHGVHFSTSQLPKVVRTWGVFVHLDLEMCFAPQRRALFWHLNFQ